jgi:hypothetical protein
MATLNDSECNILVHDIFEELEKSYDRFETISKFFDGNGSWQYKLGSLIELLHGDFDVPCFISEQWINYDEFHHIFKCKDKFYKLTAFLNSINVYDWYDYSNFIIDEVKPVEKMIISYESVDK